MAKWQVKATQPHSASETRSSATVATRWFHMLHFPNGSGDIEDDVDDSSSSGGVHRLRESAGNGRGRVRGATTVRRNPKGNNLGAERS